MYRKILSVVIFVGLFLFQCHDASAYVYEIQFKYNSSEKTLRFDKARDTPVFVVDKNSPTIAEFNLVESQGPFTLTVFTGENEEVISKEINPNGEYFTYTLPYFSIANKIEIRNTQTSEVYDEWDVSEFMRCDYDGICEYEDGESVQMCLPDCASGNVKYSDETIKILSQQSGPLLDDETGDVLLMAPTQVQLDNTSSEGGLPWLRVGLMILIIAAIGIGAFFLARRSRWEEE